MATISKRSSSSSFWSADCTVSNNSISEVNAGARWPGMDLLPAAPVDEQSSDEEITQNERKKRRKLSRRERAIEAQHEEASLREAERSRLNRAAQGPESEDDFRELLQSNGSCSTTWIQYISFLLTSGDHDRARSIARRGLSMIPTEKHEDRLNLWTVLLRLEVMYGTSDTAAETTLAEAIADCDDYALLNNMAMIYQENDLLQKAESLYLKLSKKFYAELDVWVNAGLFYYKIDRLAEARALLPKALKVLSKKIGVHVTNRFAQMELKYGEPDKAKITFDSLLTNYPKRLDVWNVYADLLTKRGDIEGARNVLVRMCALQLKYQKKISMFRKWGAFETAHGDSATIQKAHSAATDYVSEQEAILDG